MIPTVLKFDIPFQTAGKEREYCTELTDVYLKPLQPKETNCTATDFIEVFHDSKKVIAGIDKQLQIQGDMNCIYDPIITNNNAEYDIYLNDNIFLLHDEAGMNYQHFFFCFIHRLYYFDQLRTIQPLKLGILEYFYNHKSATFIKEFLDLYYNQNNPIEIIIFKTNVKYKINNLILPNAFYNFPQPFGYEYSVKLIKNIVEQIPPLKNVTSDGLYISRQDVFKRNWYHNRHLKNELTLIDKIKKNLKFDIVELMDFTLKEKIQIFKSYKYIIQLHGAATTNILFSNEKTNHFIIENPGNFDWLNKKCVEWGRYTNSNIFIIPTQGVTIESERNPESRDQGNVPWILTDNNIDNIINIIQTQIIKIDPSYCL
jgi:capsular polysaccharide biosynthesis protein